MSKILVPLALLISSVGLYFSYISPTYDSLVLHKAIKERLVTAGKNYDEFQIKRETLANQSRGMATRDVERLQKIMPDVVDTVRTIIDIDNLARVNNIRIEEFSLPTPSADAGVEVDPTAPEQQGFVGEEFAISSTGGYQNFKNFLTGLESSLMLMTVTKLGVDASEEAETPAGEYTYQLAFTTYRLR
jgi:thiamine monophosphate kinase